MWDDVIGYVTNTVYNMQNNPKGRTALITGASAGIGYAIAKLLSKQGMNVVACARNTTTVEVRLS